jgi:hypothetical protein
LGFATTFQDENIEQIMDMYRLSLEMNIELATSALHNAFQFHKNDNYIYERVRTARKVENLITEMMKSKSVKNWFRGYLNLGLISKILGHDRLHACTQGTDNVFIDPWGDVWGCNVRNDLLMGNLREQSWDAIYYGDMAKAMRKKVAECPQNCWMVSSAKTAMRSKLHPKLPKGGVLAWVLYNKLRVVLGLPIKFEKYIDYSHVAQEDDASIVRRVSYLNNPDKKQLQPEQSPRYSILDHYFNR